MKIAIVAAEISPWAKAGGLADVIGAFPVALKKLGVEPVLILPGYRSLLRQLKPTTIAEVDEDHFGHGIESFSILQAEGHGGIPMYLIGHDGFFDREGVYGERGKAFFDNVMRYIFFGRAAAWVAANYVHPDVLHAHDWHAATATIMMRADEKIRAQVARCGFRFHGSQPGVSGDFRSGRLPAARHQLALLHRRRPGILRSRESDEGRDRDERCASAP